MNYLVSLYFLLLVVSTDNINQTKPEKVLQTVFNIEEFQDYLAYSPRFISTNMKQEVLMTNIPELGSNSLELNIRNKSVRIISEEEVSDLKHNFYIKITEFDIQDSKAKVILSYQNARLLYENKQKIQLDVELEQNDKTEWNVANYKLSKIGISTSY